MARPSTRPARPTRRAAPRPAVPRWAWALVALAVVAAVAWWLTRGGRPAFDGARALADVERQVAFGPRVPGSEGHAAQLRWMEAELRPLADAVHLQPVAFRGVSDTTQTWAGTNVVASFNLDAARRVALMAHWDTRATADKDPDPANRTRPVPGANDGGSGVAVLLEMARLLSEHPPAIGVDLLFFDLEDIGDDLPEGAPADAPRTPFAVGSALFVEQNPQYRPQWAILLDMVCDANLQIPQEGFSRANAPALVERVWAAARRVGAPAFLAQPGAAIEDDHVPFLRAGIPAVNLIHTPFPPTWHTLADTPDACAAASLQQVGDVLVEVLYGEGGAARG